MGWAVLEVLGWIVGGLVLVLVALSVWFETMAPGFTRALVRYFWYRGRRRSPEVVTQPGAYTGPSPYCPSGCDADAELPAVVAPNMYSAVPEPRKFRDVRRTRCRHLREDGTRDHCHDVRELRWYERNPLVRCPIAFRRFFMSAATCPELVRGHLGTGLVPNGDPEVLNVYFVNGIYTDAEAASRQRQHIQRYLDGAGTVRLIHNRIDARLDPVFLNHDYTWGISNSPARTPFRSIPALAVYALLLEGYAQDAEITIVGFSGGTLQVAMAIRAFRTEAARHSYLVRKVRFIASGNLIHRSQHISLRLSLRQFDPHVDREDPFARAFNGDEYRFDDNRSMDLGIPAWSDEINVGLWSKVATELLAHEELARYHAVINNYFREEPWPGPDGAPRAVRHVEHDALHKNRQGV